MVSTAYIKNGKLFDQCFNQYYVGGGIWVKKDVDFNQYLFFVFYYSGQQVMISSDDCIAFISKTQQKFVLQQHHIGHGQNKDAAILQSRNEYFKSDNTEKN